MKKKKVSNSTYVRFIARRQDGERFDLITLDNVQVPMGQGGPLTSMSDHSSIERPWVHKFDNTDRGSSLRDRDNLGLRFSLWYVDKYMYARVCVCVYA